MDQPISIMRPGTRLPYFILIPFQLSPYAGQRKALKNKTKNRMALWRYGVPGRKIKGFTWAFMRLREQFCASYDRMRREGSIKKI